VILSFCLQDFHARSERIRQPCRSCIGTGERGQRSSLRQPGKTVPDDASALLFSVKRTTFKRRLSGAKVSKAALSWGLGVCFPFGDQPFTNACGHPSARSAAGSKGVGQHKVTERPVLAADQVWLMHKRNGRMTRAGCRREMSSLLESGKNGYDYLSKLG